MTASIPTATWMASAASSSRFRGFTFEGEPMSRTNASLFRVTLVGAVPKVLAEKGPHPVEPIRRGIVHVPADHAGPDNGWRRRVVITEKTDPRNVDPQCDVLHRPASEQTRGYRLLRHRLLPTLDPRVIVVASAE